MDTDSVAYAASWKASPSSIVLDAVGGSFGAGARTITLEGETGALVDHAAASTPVRAGYKFVGWCTDADGSGPLLTALPDRFAGGTMTLYAQYVEDPEQYYTVTYRTYGVGVLSQRNSLASEGYEIVDRNLVGSHAEGLKGAVARSQLPGVLRLRRLVQGDAGGRRPGRIVAAGFKQSRADSRSGCQSTSTGQTGSAPTPFSKRASTTTTLPPLIRFPTFVEYYVMDDDGAYPARPVRSYASILQNVQEGSGSTTSPSAPSGRPRQGTTTLSFLEPGQADATLGVESIEGFEAQRYALDDGTHHYAGHLRGGLPAHVTRCTCRSAWAFASRRAPVASCRLKAPTTWLSRPPRPSSITC